MAEPISIAIVDDDRLYAALACAVFSRRSAFRLHGIATSSVPGATLLRESRPRVALVDWRLGDGDGAELIARLSPELPETRWILTSAFPCSELMLAADRVGASGVIDKLNFTGGTLCDAILAVAGGQEYFCPSSSALRRALRDEHSPLHLTHRQRQVLELIDAHYSRSEIAAKLGISRSVVTEHLSAIATKLALDGAPSLSVLVPRARAAGLLPKMPTRGKGM